MARGRPLNQRRADRLTAARGRLAARAVAVLAAVLLALGALPACSSSGSGGGGCGSTCRGTIDGARYLIRMPAHWNGVLLIHSHGYRSPTAADAGRPSISLGDSTGTGTDAISAALLGLGYALAGSGWARQGWSSQAAVTAADGLYHRFVDLHGKPAHTYVWGGSLGGLVTELVAERDAWVDGAAPMCGAVAGPLANFDGFLEAAWAAKVLLAPQIHVTGFTDRADAARQALAARTAIASAGRGAAGADGAARVVYLATLLGLPDRSTEHPAGHPLAALVDSVRTYVGFAVDLGFELQQTFGGNPASTSPPPTPSAAAVAAVAALGGDASRYAAQLTGAAGIAAAPAARRAAVASGEPTGRLRVPTVTLHDEADPIALVANEAVLRGRVARSGADARLLQLYAPAASATSGIGHCVFTGRQVISTLQLLDRWVRSGARPTAAVPPGLTADFTPPAWPVR